jgi:hypothetical protein
MRLLGAVPSAARAVGSAVPLVVRVVFAARRGRAGGAWATGIQRARGKDGLGYNSATGARDTYGDTSVTTFYDVRFP